MYLNLSIEWHYFADNVVKTHILRFILENCSYTFITDFSPSFPPIEGKSDFVVVTMSDFYTNTVYFKENINVEYLQGQDLINYITQKSTVAYKNTATVELPKPRWAKNEIIYNYSLDLSEIVARSSQKTSWNSTTQFENKVSTWSFFCCNK